MRNKPGIIIFKDVIWALLNREFARRFEKGYLSYFWAIGDNFVHVLMWWGIWYYRGRTPFLSMELPVFILTGVCPFFLFLHSITHNLTVYESNLEFLSFRQVTIFSSVISRVLVEVGLSVSALIIGLVVLNYFGFSFKIYNYLQLFLSFFMILIFSTGVSLFISIPGYFFPDFTKIFPLLIRILYFISGVFYDISLFPPEIRHWMQWNPLLQMITAFRYSFTQWELPSYVDFRYLWIIIISTLFLGFLVYYNMRFYLTANARPRV